MLSISVHYSLCVFHNTLHPGLVPSMVTGYALRHGVPKMRAETLHLGLVLFGFLHTLLGLNEAAIEANANDPNERMLQLQWAWSFR